MLQPKLQAVYNINKLRHHHNLYDYLAFRAIRDLNSEHNEGYCQTRLT